MNFVSSDFFPCHFQADSTIAFATPFLCAHSSSLTGSATSAVTTSFPAAKLGQFPLVGPSRSPEERSPVATVIHRHHVNVVLVPGVRMARVVCARDPYGLPRTAATRETTESISSPVVPRPRLNRTAPMPTCSGTRIAASTGESSTRPA